MKQGNVTFTDLRAANIGEYERIQYRILHFPFIYQLVRQPHCIAFNPQAVQGGSRIDAEFMFYNHFSARYIHLGIRKETSTGLYVPVTFLERKQPYDRMAQVIVNEIIISHEGSKELDTI